MPSYTPFIKASFHRTQKRKIKLVVSTCDLNRWLRTSWTSQMRDQAMIRKSHCQIAPLPMDTAIMALSKRQNEGDQAQSAQWIIILCGMMWFRKLLLKMKIWQLTLPHCLQSNRTFRKEESPLRRMLSNLSTVLSSLKTSWRQAGVSPLLVKSTEALRPRTVTNRCNKWSKIMIMNTKEVCLAAVTPQATWLTTSKSR